MYTGSVEERIYVDCMSALKQLSQEQRKLRLSDEYIARKKKKKLDGIIHSGSLFKSIRKVKNIIDNRQNLKTLDKIAKPYKREAVEIPAANYFSDCRIAVYTCVFGKYDEIQEPYCHPNNIDYYIITDLDVMESSTWKKVDLSPYQDILKGLSPVEKNRWFKMHPHLVFTEYPYSVYVDGNVAPVTDFTEFVNRIGDVGITMFWHSFNDCVYQEGLYNRYSVRKISTEELEKHIQYLKVNGMPEEYGMTTCNVIARKHDNKICCKLMDDWWEEFMNHCRRDQMSFPYVVWKNGIRMNQIALLGSDVWNTDSLFVVFHGE